MSSVVQSAKSLTGAPHGSYWEHQREGHCSLYRKTIVLCICFHSVDPHWYRIVLGSDLLFTFLLVLLAFEFNSIFRLVFCLFVFLIK